MNKIHSLVRSGFFLVKSDLDHRSAWKKSLITVRGCFLRLSKRQIDSSVNEDVVFREQDYFNDRYQEVWQVFDLYALSY
jgi:hypothetical protein